MLLLEPTGAGTFGGRQQQQPSRSSSLGSAGDLSTARDFVEENKLAAAAAAARRPVKAEAKAGAGAGEYLHKSDFGQVCVLTGRAPSAGVGVWVETRLLGPLSCMQLPTVYGA